MDITLYKCADDKRVVDKTLSGAITKTCIVKDDNNSIYNPRIQIAQFSGFSAYNYAYIKSYGRYYFIDDMTVDNGGLLTISLSVDVLKTYAAHIKASKALIFRQSKNVNALISDGLIPAQVNEITVTRAFSGGELSNQLPANSNNFVLTTYKGGV